MANDPKRRGTRSAEATSSKPEASHGKKKKNVKVRLIILGCVLVLLVGTVVAVLNSRGGQANDFKGVETTPDYLQDKVMNILVIGIDNDDNRPDEVWLTDVIMVVSLDLESNKASILQIPRDLYIGSDLVNTGKINALYYYGFKDNANGGFDENAEKGDINALMQVINDQFKLPIDHYVMITMEGFRTAIDMLGGIEITLDRTVDFGEGLVLDAGTHKLSGVEADLFVRNRNYATADLGRMEMQRYFMAALMSRIVNTSSMDLASLGRAIFPYLQTDFSLNQLLQLVSNIKALTSESITMVRVPGEPVPKYGYYGLDVFTAHRAELAEILNQYMRAYGEPVPEAELGVIELQKTIDWYDENTENLGEITGS